jgi:hypothetical protein
MQRPGEEQLGALIDALETASRENPSQTWRVELLADAYALRAERSSNLGEAARALRMTDRLRDRIATSGKAFGWTPTLGSKGSPSDRDTVPFFDVAEILARERARVQRIRRACWIALSLTLFACTAWLVLRPNEVPARAPRTAVETSVAPSPHEPPLRGAVARIRTRR